MDRYDDIVVGSGISGMTMALLLARNGHRVLLLEKSPDIGGSLARFRRKGIPFDTGFHFTGGLGKGGILDDMLTVLGLADEIEPIYLQEEGSNTVVFQEDEVAYELPTGLGETIARLKDYFPREASAIDRYFEILERVFKESAGTNLRMLSVPIRFTEEDGISLQEALDNLTDDRRLKGLLSVYCACHGSKPSEISLANHCRVAYPLHTSVARVKDGGDAFIRAFRGSFREHEVAICCGTSIERCLDIQDNRVRRFLLSDGKEVEGKNCVFTIHPKEILRILPREYMVPAFVERIGSFKSSIGFFGVFGVIKSERSSIPHPSIRSLFPTTEVNELLDPAYMGDPALAIMTSTEKVNGRLHHVVAALEPSFLCRVERWSASTVGKRPPEYYEYKNQRVASIRNRVEAAYGSGDAKFEAIEGASVLTFRDYLNSPDGSAYGIRQRVGQFNLFGRLRLRNLHVAGQSALLPGIVGAMSSSFLVAQGIIGKDKYGDFLNRRLAN